MVDQIYVMWGLELSVQQYERLTALAGLTGADVDAFLGSWIDVTYERMISSLSALDAEISADQPAAGA